MQQAFFVLTGARFSSETYVAPCYRGRAQTKRDSPRRRRVGRERRALRIYIPVSLVVACNVSGLTACLFRPLSLDICTRRGAIVARPLLCLVCCVSSQGGGVHVCHRRQAPSK